MPARPQGSVSVTKSGIRPLTVTISSRISLQQASRQSTLDFGFLRRVFLGMALLIAMVSPFAPDPLPFAVGGFVPWIVLTLLDRPGMPAAVIFYFVWQWGQVFARALQSMVDGERLAAGYFGPGVLDAYWYMLASVVVLAVAFRMVLGNLPAPTPVAAEAHLRWRPRDLFIFYCLMLVLAIACSYGYRLSQSLSQQFDALARIQIVAAFLLFTTVLSVGRGGRLVAAVVAIEILIGMSGLLSNFRSVFIFLGIAAVAARMKLSATTIMGSVAAFVVLLSLGLFWTAVKTDYRDFLLQGEDVQLTRRPVGERFAYLGSLALSADDIDWKSASYTMLSRFAYVDIFGSVIGYAEGTRREPHLRQWQESFDHIFKPRLFFPDKPMLSDTETYARLTGTDPELVLRNATSISVGYMAENYVDLGFPGMLVGIFVLGVIIAGAVRYFMRRDLPWMVRQGIVLALLYSVGGNGVEVSLPKVLGATIMFFIVFALLTKFVLPYLLRSLDTRAELDMQLPLNAPIGVTRHRKE